jgi:voltage-gated potassium channel|tara:strand:- start:421 stop:690 length:270 start_codon:yes stop_codon:yes gene_type:complete
MLFFSATGICYLENPQQSEEFSSIINSFWWSVASLTGVYFKDIYPITLGGKIFGTIISLIGVGVGVVAIPTGIISASFVDIINQSHKDK